MANFDNSNAALQSVGYATNLLPSIRTMYAQGKAVQALMQRYTAGVDTKYIAAINALYNSAERAEFQAMLVQVNALVTDWETNHAAAIGFVPGGS